MMIFVTSTGVTVPEACLSMPTQMAPVTPYDAIVIDYDPINPWELIQ